MPEHPKAGRTDPRSQPSTITWRPGAPLSTHGPPSPRPTALQATLCSCLGITQRQDPRAPRLSPAMVLTFPSLTLSILRSSPVSSGVPGALTPNLGPHPPLWIAGSPSSYGGYLAVPWGPGLSEALPLGLGEWEESSSLLLALPRPLFPPPP